MTVEDLYAQLIDAWNRRDAEAFASLFTLDGETVGFDGSELFGQAAIRAELSRVFADHTPNKYVYKIKKVETVSVDVAIVGAHAGMRAEDQGGFDPKLHAVHRLTAVHRGPEWRIVMFQTTPAQLHGRPDLVAALTAELESASQS
ncbi:MAG: SgcJ/EcaC family oxidoreductase [Deltaproteobacteria bacterium]|nr:SgcJ/EcaC family oxidoreductase [Deltaproteobacteria bacterium]